MKTPAGRSRLSAAQLQQIDQICNRFESELSGGQRPSVESILAQAEQDLHTELLLELARLEAHYCTQEELDSLVQRYPQLAGAENRVPTCDSSVAPLPHIPGFEFIRELGRGGMGVVYQARDLKLQRHVAIKMLHSEGMYRAEHEQRMLGEARAVAQLRHPNVVQLLDARRAGDKPYLVLEYIDGGSLSNRMQGASLAPCESAELVMQISRAVHEAHKRNIVHRDLKPANVLISSDGTPRVSDFGLARRLDDDIRQTTPGLLVGTPAYMAPEQAQTQVTETHPAVDIYSLGAILYELLTGRPPFQAASILETLELLKNEEPQKPRSLNSKIPADLETICLKCLEKTPGRRYMSAELLADDLKRFLDGDPIIARVPSWAEQIYRWCRKQPLAAGLGASLAMTLLIGFAVAVWQWYQTDAQRILAEQQRLAAENARREAERQKELAVHQKVVAETERERAVEQQELAIQQRQLAEKHLAAAEKRFRLAQAPIHELIKLGSELVVQPELELRGRKALELATRFRQQLLNEKPDDPENLFVTTVTLNRLAWTLLEHGQFTESDSTYTDAVRMAQQLAQLEASSLRSLRLLRELQFQHSICQLRLNDSVHAEITIQQSLETTRRILESPSARAGDYIAYGAIVSNSAGILSANGKKDAASDARQESINILRDCAVRFPKDPSIHGNLALALSNRANELRTSNPQLSGELAIEALQIRRAVASKARVPRDEIIYLLRSLAQTASWYRTQGRLDEAELLVQEAIKEGRVACQRFPQLLDLRVAHIDALLEGQRIHVERKANDNIALRYGEISSELDAAKEVFENVREMTLQRAWNNYLYGHSLTQPADEAKATELLNSSLEILQNLQSTDRNPQDYETAIALVKSSLGQ